MVLHLEGFEMASGLKVNFFKSCLIGVNIDGEFMNIACNFLNCRRRGIPFNYLGLPVSGNVRKFSTWDTFVEKVEMRFINCGNKYVSFGGRITLINSFEVEEGFENDTLHLISRF